MIAALVPLLLGLGVAPSLAVDRTAAYSLLAHRVTENRQAFFVYKDADAGANHGFPSGFFGRYDKIQADAACVDDPASANGCSADPARLDRARGNVLRISFDPLTASEFAGVNIEEPEHWGARSRGKGYDLRGATAVVLDVRSPSGIRVQFGVGGRTTKFMNLPRSESFETITIPFTSLDAVPALNDVHILFTVVINGENAPNGGTLLLDNIRFTPVPITQQAALGFPLSTETFGVVPVQDDCRAAYPFRRIR